MDNKNWVMRSLVGVGMLLLSTQASAGLLKFEWSFANVVGTVSGLTDNATSAASQVTITSAPGTTFVLPQDTIVAGAIVDFNNWTVMNGALTGVDFLSSGFDLAGDVLDLLGTVPGASGILIDGLTDEVIEGKVTATPLAVPEPGTLGLLGAGLLGLGFMRRKQAT